MAIITITKASFSGAKKISKSLAARLKYPCMGRRELFARASEDFDFPEKELVEAVEEPAKIWNQNREKQSANYNLIRATFLKRCSEENGNLIYHGHAGPEFVRRIPHALRILFVADMEHRIEEAMKRNSLNRDQAIELIHKIDRKVTKWSQQMHTVNWRDFSFYDMVFHIGRLSAESAEEAVVGIIESGGFKLTEDSKKAFDDELLGSIVWSKLTNDEQTSSSIVETIAEQGCVTISGVARSKEQKEAITSLTASIKGVKSVQNKVGIGAIWRS